MPLSSSLVQINFDEGKVRIHPHPEILERIDIACLEQQLYNDRVLEKLHEANINAQAAKYFGRYEYHLIPRRRMGLGRDDLQ